MNEKLAALGVGEEELRVDPDGSAPGSGLVVLTGFALARLEKTQRQDRLMLGSILVGEPQALEVLDHLAPGWRSAADDAR